MLTGAAEEAPRVCTGHPGMWRDRPRGPLSQEPRALGQEGEAPPQAAGTGHRGGCAQGTGWEEALCGRVWSAAGGPCLSLGFRLGLGLGPGQPSLARCPWCTAAWPGAEMSLLGGRHHY